MINISEIQKLTSPNPFAVISTKIDDDNTNVMALSWWTFLSNNPAKVGICLSKKGFSGELIEKYKTFAISLVGENVSESAFMCGTCSGRDINKAEKFNLKLKDCNSIDNKCVAESRVVMECQLLNTIDMGDHNFFIGEIVDSQINPDIKAVYAFDGYKKLKVVD